MDFKEDEREKLKFKVGDETQAAAVGRTSQFKPGMKIAGKYTYLGALGSGGMSAVFKAHDPLLDRTVAIKMLHHHLTDNESLFKRLRQEGRAISQLNHANIVRVHEFGITEDTSEPYIVMDYVEGESLQRIINREGGVNKTKALDSFKQVTRALVHAHDRGVLHRDLKPSNIMIGRDDQGQPLVTLVDLGIARIASADSEVARLTATGEIFGSPMFMSPEQARGEEVDVRSELYSLGCLMYETLTGKPVVEGNSPLEVIFNQINTEPEEMTISRAGNTIPPDLKKIVTKLLNKDPEKRYQSAGEVLRELDACELHGGGAADVSSRRSQNEERAPTKNPARTSLLWALCVMVIGIAAYCGSAFVSPLHRPLPPVNTSSSSEKTLSQQHPGLASGTRTEVDLSNIGITDDALKSIGQTPYLRKVWLRGDNQITDNGVAYLAPATSLAILDLADTAVTDKCGATISRFKNLTDLGMDNTHVTDAFIESVPDSVVWISLNGTAVTNAGVERLIRLPNLEGVFLSGDKVDDATTAALAKIPRLHKVYLSSRKLTDRSAYSLCSASDLTELSIHGGALTDAGVIKLARKHKGLTKLTLTGNAKVTNASLDAISKLTSLEELDMDGTGITAPGMERILSKLPALKIVQFDTKKR